MTGLRFRIPTNFTDTSIPVLPADPLLPSAGALFLTDLTHLGEPWSSGVPANSSRVPNIAWKQAAAMLGSGTKESLAGEIYNVGLTGTKGLVERTPKGGLHAIVSPTVTTGSSDGFNIAVPDAVYNFMRTNAHLYYASLWQRVTRAASDPTGASKVMMQISTPSSWGVGLSQKANLAGTPLLGRPVDESTTVPVFRNTSGVPIAAFATDAITALTPYLPGHRSLFLVGNRSNTNSQSLGQAGSRIVYRVYLEDLTVSGRTYAQADAADYALFTKELLTVGGRYYGDTFTNPTTIA